MDGHENLKNTLIEFSRTIHNLLLDENVNTNSDFRKAYSNGYILDIGIIEEDDGSLSCTVIELNPFLRTTGAGLFSWNEVYVYKLFIFLFFLIKRFSDKLIESGDNSFVELRLLYTIRENIGGLLNDVILPALDINEKPYYFYFADVQVPGYFDRILGCNLI